MTKAKDKGQMEGKVPTLDDLRQFITRDQLSSALNVSIGTIDRWRRLGVVPFYELRCDKTSTKGILRFKIEDVLKTLEKFKYEAKGTVEKEES